MGKRTYPGKPRHYIQDAKAKMKEQEGLEEIYDDIFLWTELWSWWFDD